MSQLTHKYINRIPQREENLFLEEYYSGTDTKVFIDNEEQTEIAYISYSMSEQLKPLYGYASRTWDDVAVGNRIVTGAFKVSIKNPEEQSSREEVIEHQYIDKEQSTLEELDVMNKAEAEAKKKEEWIDDTSGETSGNGNTSSTPDENFNQEVQEYQIKLQSLGYSINVADGLTDKNGDCFGPTRDAIIQFCRDNNISEANSFKTHIKNKIEELLVEGNREIEIYSRTPLLAGPGNEYGTIIILEPGTTVYLVGGEQTGNDVWDIVKTKNSFTGYIPHVHPE